MKRRTFLATSAALGAAPLAGAEDGAARRVKHAHERLPAGSSAQNNHFLAPRFLWEALRPF
jgi:hypothetical protein